MQTKKIELEVPKEITEIGEALGTLLSAIGTSLSDGFQPGTDIPVIITTAIATLGTAVNGAQDIPAEFQEDSVMAVMGCLNPVAVGIKDLLKLRNSSN